MTDYSANAAAGAPLDALKAAIEKRAAQALNPAAAAVAESLLSRFPGAALLFYGSGNSVSKTDDPTSLMYDFYVIGASYNELYSNAWLKIANRAIPPNVFYCETPSPFGLLRAKYAVLSVEHFERLVSRHTFHSYFWARFAQPCAIIDPANALHARLTRALAAAIATFVSRAAPIAPSPFDAAGLWLAGLSASYKAELRAEDEARVRKLIASYGDWIDRVTGPALTVAFGDRIQSTGAGYQFRLKQARWREETAWRLRSVFGAVLSVARLLKATQTFKGGIEYIAWKIERHSGIEIPLKTWEKRHPMIASPIVAMRYYRLKSKKTA